MTTFRKALIFGAAIAACLALRPAQVDTQRVSEQFNGHDVMPGEVLVRLRDALQLPAIRQLTDAADDRPVGNGAWRRIRSNSRTVQTLIQLLAARGDVEVEPNYILQAIGVPNDPSLPLLWNLGGSPGGIHATSVWNVTTGNTATVVGVVDSGIDYTHPDLAANVWSAPSQFTVTVGGRSITCPAGSHGFNAIQFTCDPLDDLGHGTHVSGTVGAVGNNGVGVVGVNWTTRIMGLKFISSAGSGSSADAINAIDFAIQTRALFGGGGGSADVRVLSNSYGGGGFETAFSDAIGRANTAGMLFVAAAGNNGLNNDVSPFYPASYPGPNVMAVAASDGNDNLAGFSNYGAQSVELAAPGVSILSTTPSNTYSYLSGTSMATPHVSGAAALVLSACRLTTAQLVATLKNTVDLVPAFAGLTVTGGRLDVDNAVRSCATFPTITLSSPTDGSTYNAPAQIALSASASDPDSISRVEFYDGTTLITTSTTAPYGGTWSNAGVGAHDVTAVAYDSFGLSSVSAHAHVTVTTSSSGAQTLLTSETPVSYPGDAPYELGVRLVADVDGQFTAIRFWKAAQESGTVHVGRVWTASGQLLGSVTFTNESASGWQQQLLPSPLGVTAGTEYVVSVNDADYFADTQHAFDNGLIHGHLRAVSGTNGVYGRPAGTFPSSSYASSNYFRDVVFVPGTTSTDTQPPTVAITQPTPNSVVGGSVTIAANATDDVGVAGVQFQIDGVNLGQEDGSAPYTATWDSTTATNGSHSVTAIARDGANHTASQTVTVTVSNSVVSNTLLTSQTPGSFPSDATTYELGVRVVADADGQFTAIRFWKAAQESSTVHVGRVWTASGLLLGSVTFTGESASGWQQQPLTTPVAVTAGTEYVVSVNTADYFADTQHVFDNGLVHGHLRAVSWANGVYGPRGVFPTSSYASSNYFRDVVFVPGTTGTDTQPPMVAITQPTPNSVVGGSVTIAANATDDVGVAGVQFQIDGVNLGQEDGSAPYTATWDSTTATNGSHSVTAIARDGANHTASQTVTVTVSNSVVSNTLLTSQTPGSFPSDATTYELGVRVVADADGQFTAIRFWKAAQESSTVHVGRVWTASGLLLGSVTFTGESASGWQQQPLTTPVAVTAGTEYVVSVNTADYFADTQHVFDNGLVHGHLRAVSWTNGVYGPRGAFPTSSYGSSNYFRDVVFVPSVGF